MNSVMKGFDRYWNSWKVAEDWRRRHSAASLSVNHAQNSILYPRFPQNEPFRMIDHPFARNGYEEYETGHDVIENEEWEKHPISLCDGEFDDSSNDSSNELELEFVINEEMIAFFEQSMRHKEELRKERELLNKSNNSKDGRNTFQFPDKKEEENFKVKEEQSTDYEMSGYETDKEVPNVNLRTQKKIDAMKNIYGDAMPKIYGMETALQLSFNRLRDRNKPTYWPCIPFRP